MEAASAQGRKRRTAARTSMTLRHLAQRSRCSMPDLVGNRVPSRAFSATVSPFAGPGATTSLRAHAHGPRGPPLAERSRSPSWPLVASAAGPSDSLPPPHRSRLTRLEKRSECGRFDLSHCTLLNLGKCACGRICWRWERTNVEL